MQPWQVPIKHLKNTVKPLLVFIHADNFLYIDIYVDMNLPWTPECINLWNKIRCGTLSNAFEKSMKIQ